MSCSHTKSTNNVEAKMFKVLGSIKHKLLVMSGKGGVGKSTVAANLAISFSRKGLKTGLLDVDLHGPSISGLLGLIGLPLNVVAGAIEPYVYDDNLKVVTVQGLLKEANEALIWRGPMKISVIQQLIGEVNWGELDVLVIDCPPGTGDEPLSIAQYIPDCKAVVVTTPQEIALADVRKSISFCQELNLQIAGIIENMSGFKCPSCGVVHDIFKTGGGQKTALDWEVPFLGKIPLDQSIVLQGDNGRIGDMSNYSVEKAFSEIAASLEQQLAATTDSLPNETVTVSVALPLANDKLCMHFGHCEKFKVYRTQNSEILKEESLIPPPHEPGVIPRWLMSHRVNVLLAGGIGERARGMLEENGVKVIIGVKPSEPEMLVKQYLSGTLEATGQNACDH